MAHVFENDAISKAVKTEFPAEDVKPWSAVWQELSEQFRKLDHDDPMFSIHGVGPGTGHRFPLHDWPTFHGQITAIPAQLDDVFKSRIATLVTEAVRDKIEALEPGVHRFFPVELTMPDGTPTAQRYYGLNICVRLDAVDPDKSTGVRRYHVLPAKLPKVWDYSFGGDKIEVAVRKSVIAGHAIWYDYRLCKAMVSDELADWFEAEGIKGWSPEFGKTNTSYFEV